MSQFPNPSDPRQMPAEPLVAGRNPPDAPYRRPGQLTVLGWFGVILGLLAIADSLIDIWLILSWFHRPRIDSGLKPGAGLYVWQTCIVLGIAVVAPCVLFMLLTASHRLLNDLPGGLRLMRKYLHYTIFFATANLVPVSAFSDGINHYNAIDLTPSSPGIGCVTVVAIILFTFWAFFVWSIITDEVSIHWDAWISAGRPAGGPPQIAELAQQEVELQRQAAIVQQVAQPGKPRDGKPDALIVLLIVAYPLGTIAIIGNLFSITTMFGWLVSARPSATAASPQPGLFEWQILWLIALRAAIVLAGILLLIAATKVSARPCAGFGGLYFAAAFGVAVTLAGCVTTTRWSGDIAYMTSSLTTIDDANTSVQFTQICTGALALGVATGIVALSRRRSVRDYCKKLQVGEPAQA